MSIWDKAKSVLGIVAPVIGTALGGPLGGIAARELANALGLPQGATDDAVSAAVAGATPDQLLAIKQAEIAFQTRMRELDIDMERVHQSDRDSARQRAVTMNDHKPVYIGVLVILIWATINFTLIMSPEPPKVQPETLGRLLGMVDAVTMAFVYWLWGSSAGSPKKTT